MIGRTLGLLAFAVLLAAGGAKAQTYSTLYSFCSQTACTDGAGSQNGLIADGAGNLYGTTLTSGQQGGHGVAFELSPNGSGGWTYSVIHTFCAENRCVDGVNPSGPLIIDGAGSLYGVTTGGGKGVGYGLVYKLTPEGGGRWKFAVLRDLCKRVACLDGAIPSGGLSYFGQRSGAPYDGTSPLFGTTQTGGAYQKGVVYRLTPPPEGAKRTWWTNKTLYSFCPEGGDCLADGYQPRTGVIVDAPNRLYGTTYYGGQFYSGTVFALTRSGNTWTKQILHTLCSANRCNDGALPLGLAENDAGTLFGVTLTGPHKPGCVRTECGTIFELSPQNGTFVTLYSFCSQPRCTDGLNPSGPVTILDNGDLVGVTSSGGDRSNYRYGGGVLYRLSGTTLSVLHDFCTVSNCVDGLAPSGSVILDAQGRMFGTTVYGGTGTYGIGGTIYELAP